MFTYHCLLVGTMTAAATCTSYSITLHTSSDEQWAMLKNSSVMKLTHAMKELADNSLAVAEKSPATEVYITITITKVSDVLFNITVQDSGPGIPLSEIAQCLSMGKAKRTGLNEHGCGLKNVLAFCCPELAEGQWYLVTRPAGSDKTYRVASPWSSSMVVTETTASDHIYPTGVTISMNVKDNVMRFYSGARGSPTLDRVVSNLKHHLGVTYAHHSLMDHPRRVLVFTINGERIRKEVPEHAVPKGKHIEEMVSLAPSAPPITISLQHLFLTEPNAEGKEFFRRNMNSSGVYLYQYGRLVTRITPMELYGLSANHNDFNPFFCVVKLTGDPAGIPATVTTKNGIIETDPRTQGLFEFIQKHVPEVNARNRSCEESERGELSLTEDFIKKQLTSLGALLGSAYTISTNQRLPIGDTGETSPPVDVIEVIRTGTASIDKVVLYEAKPDVCLPSGVLQLYGNYVLGQKNPAFAGLSIECILLCKRLSSAATVMLEELRARDTSFKCSVKTWSDVGISTVL